MRYRQPALKRRFVKLIVFCLLVTALVMPPGAVRAQGTIGEAAPPATAEPSTAPSGDNMPSAVDWLEPQGINVIDLVGLVPEDHLDGMVIGFTVAGGVLQYMAGSRKGDTVTLRAKIWPRFETYDWTRFNCVSLRAISDHWAVSQPTGTVRIFDGERDITDQIIQFDYFHSGLIQPAYAPGGVRYRERLYGDLNWTEDGAFIIPENMGCTITLEGIWESGDLTAVFTFDAPQVITVKTVGRQTVKFNTYRGPGWSGQVSSLQKQLDQFGKHHDKFLLQTPAEAEYVLVNYPTSPVSPYVVGDIARNIRWPSSGTYRLAHGEATLSIDHNISMALPLYAQWQDRDQAGGEFLKHIEGINTLTALEYFVPTGVEYDPCMQYGGCSDELLQEIVNTQMEATLYYYEVDRVSDDLVRIPLRQVGPGYGTSSVASVAGASADEVASVGLWPATATIPPTRIFLPAMSQPVPELVPPNDLPADDPNGCPCGWFTPDGRMVDTIPKGPME